jgi:hypothetical protein
MSVRTRTYGAASAVMTVFAVIAGVLVLGILLILVGANQQNTLVDFFLDIGRFFARPFNHLIPQDDAKQDITVNWGIGAIAYLVVGSLLARLVRRA